MIFFRRGLKTAKWAECAETVDSEKYLAQIVGLLTNISRPPNLTRSDAKRSLLLCLLPWLFALEVGTQRWHAF